MAALYLGRLWSLLTGTELVMALLWLGLATFTVALVVLIWTRWGQYRPLRKCLVLSILAHLLLAGYATTVRIVALVPPADVPIAYIEGPAGRGAEGDDPAGVVAAPEARRAAAETSPPLLAIPSQPTPPAEARVAAAGCHARSAAPAGGRGSRQADGDGGPRRRSRRSAPAGGSARRAGFHRRHGRRSHRGRRTRLAFRAAAGRLPSALAASASAGPPAQPMPDVYRLRMVPNHARLAEGHGGSPETEAAVQAALAMVGRTTKAPTGIGAPGNTRPAARPRPTAATANTPALDADSAMTGLALLAFLGSGETHRDGPHREDGPPRTGVPVVGRGRRRQPVRPDGYLCQACIRTPWPPSP